MNSTSTATLERPAAARPRPTGFFAHHGLWAPGVRMFRSLRFKSKAMLICAVFAMPIAYLGWTVIDDKAQSIAFTVKERAGVDYAKALIPVLKTAQARRLQATAQAAGKGDEARFADARAKADEAYARLAALDARVGGDLGTAPLRRQLEAAQAALQVEAEPEEVLAAHSAYIDALLALLAQAGDGSNLTLDPDLDSYYVMDAALVRAPQLLELGARIGETGAEMLSTGTGTAAQLRFMGEAVPLYSFHASNLAANLARSIHATPDLASLRPDEAIAAANAFVTLARTSFQGGEVAQAERIAFPRVANLALERQFELSGRMMDTLDALLSKRIDGLRAQRNLAAGVIAASALLAIYLFYSFFLVTQGGLNEVKWHLEAMTGGDLTTRPRPLGRDEAALLMSTVSAMQASLRDIVSRVRTSSQAIVLASTEMSTAARDLSTRTEQTAASLEETASAMEEIGSTTQGSSDHAREAALISVENAQTATRGGVVIRQVVATMQDIHASSSKISEIIGVIDGIAFQTNILALNAAVEAARAGDQGRGFAVVASEVRMLAQRSAAAAKEIKALIVESGEKVKSGAEAVRSAGATIEELVSHADRIRQSLAGISLAAGEQSQGIVQVSTAVQNIDQMTQENSALVEQSAVAAAALKDQALDLADQVANFRLA